MKILLLQLSRKNKNMDCLSADKIFIMQPLNEEDQKPNPVVERVKMIMIAGLFIVHANRYIYIISRYDNATNDFFTPQCANFRNFRKAVVHDNVISYIYTRQSRKPWQKKLS